MTNIAIIGIGNILLFCTGKYSPLSPVHSFVTLYAPDVGF